MPGLMPVFWAPAFLVPALRAPALRVSPPRGPTLGANARASRGANRKAA